MKVKDLIPGNIYYWEQPLSNEKAPWFVRIKSLEKTNDYEINHNGCIQLPYLDQGSSFYNISANIGWGSGSCIIKDTIRLATHNEVIWFLACMKQNKYIPIEEFIPPQPVIINDYQLY